MLGWIIFFAVFIFSLYYMTRVKEKVLPDSKLTSNELLIVLITEFLNPVIAGAVYYYGWRKNLPTKAKQANRYSWIMAGLFVLMVIVFASRSEY